MRVRMVGIALVLSLFATLGTEYRAGVASPTAIPVRVMALGVGFPLLLMSAWQEADVGQKYGIDLRVKTVANLTEQWTGIRSGSIDMVMGNFLDLLRQRQAGLRVTAFQFCYNYDDPIVTLPDKPYRTLGDLRGTRVGVTNVTELPVLLYRVAGLKAYHFDIIRDAQIVQASPSLLPQMLLRGQLDAT
jgi:ABC-type nitrate/sulfonate/bicarbonate transport system substrate-binding protein